MKGGGRGYGCHFVFVYLTNDKVNFFYQWKKIRHFFLQISAAFFVKFLEISVNFQDFPGKIPTDIKRVHSVFFPWKKNEKVLFFLLFSRNILKNFTEQNFLLNFCFFNFFREIKGSFFSAEFRRINYKTFSEMISRNLRTT